MSLAELKTKRPNTGPVVDGSFVPELPSLLLLHNRFDRSINVMIGNNGDEGFGYPALSNGSEFAGKRKLPLRIYMVPRS